MILTGASSTKLFRAGLSLLWVLGASHAGLASEPNYSFSGPDCPAHELKNENNQQPTALVGNNNAQVLSWKANSQNQFHDRALVQGNIVRVYPDRNGHNHFAIQIGPSARDTVEIIYNQDFGSVPQPTVGTPVEACGDYITSTGPSPGPAGVVYPASPDGALVHWVHMAPARSGHNSGYLVVGGVLTGQGSGNGFD